MKANLFRQKTQHQWKKFTQGSVNRQIFGAAMTIALSTILVKAGGVVKELIVAWRFGTRDDLDAFLIALVIPSFLLTVVSGSFSVVLMPHYIEVRESQGDRAAQKLFSSAMGLGIVLMISVTIAMVVTAPWYLPWLASGFSVSKLALTEQILRSLTPIVLLAGIANIWGALLQANERFVLTSFVPLLTSVASILLILGFQGWGIFSLAMGLVLGFVLEAGVLAIALVQQRISIFPRWYGMTPALKTMIHQYFPVVMGSFLMGSSLLVDQAMAAMLLPGSVAALGYGNRVIALPLGLATTALSTAVLPYFSKMVARQDWVGIQHTLNRYLMGIAIVSLPLLLIFTVGSEPIIRMLFQRGSFVDRDTQLVAQIQSAFALQIPFYVGALFLVRLISALRINQVLVWGSSLNLIVNITLNYVFSQWMGITGIALSTTCVYVTSFIFLFCCVKHHLKQYSPEIL
jgi:putative peptidoglycan lipid II flippase